MAQGAKKNREEGGANPYKRELADRIARALKQYNANARNGEELSQADLGRLGDPTTGSAFCGLGLGGNGVLRVVISGAVSGQGYAIITVY